MYKGSEEGLADRKQAYLNFTGNNHQLTESVLSVQYTEEPKVRNLIQQAVPTRGFPSHSASVNESKQKMNAGGVAQEEASEPETSRKGLTLWRGR